MNFSRFQTGALAIFSASFTQNKLALGYLRTMDDCEAVAGFFESTCGDAIDAADWADAPGQMVTCEGPNACVGESSFDDADDYSCTHTYKLCVTCDNVDNSDDNVHIRVQTNGMPNLCYSIPQNSDYQADYHNMDWTNFFNANVYS